MAKLSVFPLKKQPNKQGLIPLHILLSHNSGKTTMATEYAIPPSHLKKGKLPPNNPILMEVLTNVVAPMNERLKALQDIEDMSAKEVLKAILTDLQRDKSVMIDFFTFADKYIEKVKKQGKIRSAANLQTCVNMLRDYSGKRTLYTQEITLRFLNGVRDYLLSPRRITRINQGKPTTITRPPLTAVGVNNYIRDFRILFNALKLEYNDEDMGYIPIPHNPFQKFKMLIVNNRRGYRSISAEQLRRIIALDRDSLSPAATLARDMYMLSFFLMGISPTDIYTMTKAEVNNGRLSYKRDKTKDRRADQAYISIAIPPQAQQIIDRYKAGKGYESYLYLSNKYSNMNNFNRRVNKGLQEIKQLCYIDIDKFTWYSARHTWASIACNECGFSNGDVARALNHIDINHKVTNVYIKDDWSKLDKMNEVVIDAIVGIFQDIMKEGE